MAKNDFNKLFCFIKGVLISAEVIKASKQTLTHDIKYHFNHVLSSCKLFEKHIHTLLGKDYAQMEDDINSCLIGIVWNIYEMKPEEREAFIDYMEKWEYKDGK
jgi:hypothetical protein